MKKPNITASQMMAVLLERLGEPQAITEADVAHFPNDLPTLFEFDTGRAAYVIYAPGQRPSEN